MRLALSCGVLLLALPACQERQAVATGAKCQTEPPGLGMMIVRRVACTAEIPADGDGRTADWFVANAHYRAIFRHPQASLTQPGLPGGTLVDFAPWGEPDRLHEVIPIVSGGWIQPETVTIDEHGLRLSGESVSFPIDPPSAPGQPVALEWQFSADSPWIHVEGADGLWVHPSKNTELLGNLMTNAFTTYATDKGVTIDYGGAIWFEGAKSFTVQPLSAALDPIYTSTPRVRGEAPNALHLEFLSADDVVGRIAPVEGQFDTNIPPETDAIRSVGASRTASEALPVQDQMTVALLPGREIQIEVDWGASLPRPVSLQWDHPRLGPQAELLGPEGGPLELPTDDTTLVWNYGIEQPDSELFVASSHNPKEPLLLTPSPADFRSRYALAALPWATDRSATYRGRSSRALKESLKFGIDWAVLAPENDISFGEARPADAPHILWRDGAHALHPDGWSILSWPWKETPKRSGRGLPPIQNLSPKDALRVLAGSHASQRFTAVDVSWLAVAQNPYALENLPDLVRITSSMDEPDPLLSLQPWFAWLDQWIELRPAGPLNWVEIASPAIMSGADIEAGFLNGSAIATTGPLLKIVADGVSPGQIAPSVLVDLGTRRTPHVQVEIETAIHPITELFLVGDEGRILMDWSSEEGATPHHFFVARPEKWMVAIGTFEDGHWAVTSPIWFSRPQ